MAADKLIPTAITLSNNLRNIRYSTGGTYKLPAKKVNNFSNPYVDAVEFLTNVYNREVQIAVANTNPNAPLPTPSLLLSRRYTPNVNTQVSLGTVVAFSELEWEHLQIAVSRCFNIIYPFDIAGPWTTPEIEAYNNLMGVFFQEPGEGYPLFGADGSPLGTYGQGIDWANAWNDVKVPYDASIGVVTPFVAPILQPVGASKYYYRYTGLRRWFGFEGYDKV